MDSDTDHYSFVTFPTDAAHPPYASYAWRRSGQSSDDARRSAQRAVRAQRQRQWQQHQQHEPQFARHVTAYRFAAAQQRRQ